MSSKSKVLSQAAEIHERDRISVVWTLVSCCVTIALLILFNGYSERVGIWLSADRPESFVPLLGPQFFAEILPRLNVWWALSLSLAAVNLYYGRWTLGARLGDCALAIYSIFFLIKIITSPLFGLHPDLVALGPQAMRVGEHLLPWLTLLVKAWLGVAALVILVSLIPKLRTLARIESVATA